MPKLFNINGSDEYEDQAVFGGNPTGICNLNKQRYPWVAPLYRHMIGNFWIPQKVNMTADKVSYGKLSVDEKRAKLDTLSFLIFLDSFQTANLPRLINYVTNGGIRNLMVAQNFQEVIHQESYQYILESLVPGHERDDVYNRWRTNPALMARNKIIADSGDRFAENPNNNTLMEAICVNFILEGLFFYIGFDYFDILAMNGKSVQTDIIINFIKRDEISHISIFANIIKDMGYKSFEKMLCEKMEIGAQAEIEWGKTVYNNIQGITPFSTEQRVKYLTNQRLAAVGIGPMYDVLENPYAHLDHARRGNFFESAAVIEYDTADSVPGWDAL